MKGLEGSSWLDHVHEVRMFVVALSIAVVDPACNGAWLEVDDISRDLIDVALSWIIRYFSTCASVLAAAGSLAPGSGDRVECALS